MTGGLAAPAILGYSAVAGGLGFFIGDKADKEVNEREKMLLQDKRYKDANNAADDQAKKNAQTKDLVDEIVGKLNGTVQRKPHETDEYLNQQLVIAQKNLKNGEDRLNRLRNDVDKLRKELGGNQSLTALLGLDKLSFTDKVMIVGGIVLIIFLLKK
jgi:hypothetical protein